MKNEIDRKCKACENGILSLKIALEEVLLLDVLTIQNVKFTKAFI